MQIGYDQLDKGEKVYIKCPLRKYTSYISKLTRTGNIPEEKQTRLNAYAMFSTLYGNK
jgi:hypothetical protein